MTDDATNFRFGFEDDISPLIGRPLSAWQGGSDADRDKRIRADDLLRKYLGDPVVHEFLTLPDIETAWFAWLSRVQPHDRERFLITVQSLSIAYRREHAIDAALHWAGIHLRLAQSLPLWFGPAQSRVGYGRDWYISSALAGLATLENMRGAIAHAYDLLLEAERHHEAEEEARRRDQITARPVVNRILGIAPTPVHLYRGLAQSAFRMGNEDRARYYHDLAISRRLDDPTEVQQISELILRGRFYLETGAPDKALRHFQDAVRLSETEQIQSQPTLAADSAGYAYQAMADAYGKLGIPRVALAMLGKARALVEIKGDSGRLAEIDFSAARIVGAHPFLGDSFRYLLHALEHCSVRDSPGGGATWSAPNGRTFRIAEFDIVWPILFGIVKTLESRCELLKTVEFCFLATEVAEYVRVGAHDETARIAVQDELGEILVVLARTQLALAGEQGSVDYIDAAWLAVETLRARTFLDMVGDTDAVAPEGISEAAARKEAALLDTRRQLRAQRTRSAEFWPQCRAVERELAAVWHEMASTSDAASAYVTMRQARPAAHTAVAALLLQKSAIAARGNAVMINLFFPDDDRLVALAVNGLDQHVRLATSRVDRRRLTKFVAANFGSAARVREVALDLEDLFQHELSGVVAPIVDLCDPGETVIVCPAGPLHHLPLGAARLGAGVLLDRNPLVISPSASMLQGRQKAGRHGLGRPYAVLGDPTGDLPAARSEAEELAREWGVSARLGSAATGDALLDAFQAGGTVHVAAHAGFDSDDPLASGLQMSDRVVTAREILGTKASGLDLVTLSACESGITRTNLSEDPMGLSRALLFAGADSILVSLWKVPDQSTWHLMSSFYEQVRAGVPKAEALRRAALGIRARNERLDHWAGFTLIGSWM
ncbi:CHAT domain-containing protein [Nocardia heshunensis]